MKKNKINLLPLLMLFAISLSSVNAALQTEEKQRIIEGKLITEEFISDSFTSNSFKVDSELELPNNSLDINLINSNSIPDNNIPTVRNGRLIFEAAPSGNSFPPNSVGANQLQTNSISTSKIADGAVTSSKITDNALRTQDFASGSITNSKIINNSLQGLEFSDDAVRLIELEGFPGNLPSSISNQTNILDIISFLDNESNSIIPTINSLISPDSPSFTGNTVINGDLNITGNLNLISGATANNLSGGSSQAVDLTRNISKTGGPNSVLYQSANNQTSAVPAASFGGTRLLALDANGIPKWRDTRLQIINGGQTTSDFASETCSRVCEGQANLGICLSSNCSSSNNNCNTRHGLCQGRSQSVPQLNCTCLVLDVIN